MELQAEDVIVHLLVTVHPVSHDSISIQVIPTMSACRFSSPTAMFTGFFIVLFSMKHGPSKQFPALHVRQPNRPIST